jgi:hypothetical protein
MMDIKAWYSIYFHQALAGFRAHPWYAPELARTLYRFSQLQEFEGNETGASISLAKAIELYKTIAPTCDESTPLTAADFEEIVPIPHR